MPRIYFNISEDALADWELARLKGKYKTIAALITDAFRLKKAIDHEINSGRTRIVCENPKDREDAMFIIGYKGATK